MEHNNRPQGRQKYVTNNSKGVSLRGEAKNTGPVGVGQRPGQQSSNTGHRTRSGGKGSLLAIVLLLLLGGGGGSMLFGNSDSAAPMTAISGCTFCQKASSDRTPS